MPRSRLTAAKSFQKEPAAFFSACSLRTHLIWRQGLDKCCACLSNAQWEVDDIARRCCVRRRQIPEGVIQRLEQLRFSTRRSSAGVTFTSIQNVLFASLTGAAPTGKPYKQWGDCVRKSMHESSLAYCWCRSAQGLVGAML